MYISKCKICNRITVNCFVTHPNIHRKKGDIAENSGISGDEILIQIFFDNETEPENLLQGFN